MEIGTYVVFLAAGNSGNPLCLGVDQDGQGDYTCTVAKFDPSSSATTWLVAPVPGAEGENGFILQHLDTQLCVSFADSPLPLLTLDPFDVNFHLRLDYVGGGFVAINRHDDNAVMDARGDNPAVGVPVLSWDWNGGNNQRWKFVSTSLYSGLPQ